jgi:hypothetical protein
MRCQVAGEIGNVPEAEDAAIVVAVACEENVRVGAKDPVIVFDLKLAKVGVSQQLLGSELKTEDMTQAIAQFGIETGADDLTGAMIIGHEQSRGKQLR